MHPILRVVCVGAGQVVSLPCFTKQGTMTIIITRSGRQIDLWDPRPEDIHISDIAHSLSMQCRFVGHVSEFYSVAEHSVRVSFAVPDGLGLHALLHDASEAYLGDVSTPLKSIMPRYKALEEKMMHTIYAAFDLDYKLWTHQVKQADLEITHAECRDLMPSGFCYGVENVKAHPSLIVPWSQDEARRVFLARFSALRRGEE
jgi:5'-deoxynucleotidase YfbR-like HD superfamily hydrolase